MRYFCLYSWVDPSVNFSYKKLSLFCLRRLQLEKTKNQKEKLESLCRSLQAERKQNSASSDNKSDFVLVRKIYWTWCFASPNIAFMTSMPRNSATLYINYTCRYNDLNIWILLALQAESKQNSTGSNIDEPVPVWMTTLSSMLFYSAFCLWCHLVSRISQK